MKGKRISREQAEAMVNSWSDEKVLCMIALLEAALSEKTDNRKNATGGRT